METKLKKNYLKRNKPDLCSGKALGFPVKHLVHQNKDNRRDRNNYDKKEPVVGNKYDVNTQKRLLVQPTVMQSTKIAFYAYLGQNEDNPGKHHTIIFDIQKTNVGNGYSPFSGLFTAPQDGLYAFVTSITMIHHYASFELVKNADVQGSFFIDASLINEWRSSSTTIVLELVQGDVVFVRTSSTYVPLGDIHSSKDGRSSFTVNWTIRDIPSSCIFGSNVTLFCNTSAVGLQKSTWMKQSDVILHQGFSYYPDKYTGNEVTDGSSLIIMNATESDFNTSYTCLSDVYSHEKVLVDDVLITHQQESVYKENQYFHGTINITSHSNVDICGGNLTVVCMFGASHYNVILLRNCEDTLEEGMPLDDGQTNEKIDKKEAENKAHSNNQRTNTLRHHFMTKCFHVNRNKKDVGI
ncbi:Hypothetical predicted protein [Mytilus galloprovincialis]|uniref:C1q domain-containing protein n=1 Tax=Mytilus galloprovincialis TaxID=29158 RepID=A0A8B6G1T6_MYTGA|nr:Hypothetical predicted protein [Mytilus galloprovincialis]